MENDHNPPFGNGKICYLEIPAVDIDRQAIIGKDTTKTVVLLPGPLT